MFLYLFVMNNEAILSLFFINVCFLLDSNNIIPFFYLGHQTMGM